MLQLLTGLRKGSFSTLLMYCVSQVKKKRKENKRKKKGAQNSPLYADSKPHPYVYCLLQNFLNGMGIYIAPHSYILRINTILGKTMSHTL